MESAPQPPRRGPVRQLSDEEFDELVRFNTTRKDTASQFVDHMPDSVRPTTADSRRIKVDNRSTYSTESASETDEPSQHQDNNGANSPYDPSPVHNDDVHHYDTDNITVITNSFQKLSIPSARVENDDSVVMQSSSKSPMNNVTGTAEVSNGNPDTVTRGFHNCRYPMPKTDSSGVPKFAPSNAIHRSTIANPLPPIHIDHECPPPVAPVVHPPYVAPASPIDAYQG